MIRTALAVFVAALATGCASQAQIDARPARAYDPCRFAIKCMVLTDTKEIDRLQTEARNAPPAPSKAFR